MFRKANLLVSFALVTLLVGCAGEAAPPKVNLSQNLVEVATPDIRSDREPLRMAMAAILSPQATMSNYYQLLKYL